MPVFGDTSVADPRKSHGMRLVGCDSLVLPAAHADLVADLEGRAAAYALRARLVTFPAIEDRCEQAQEREAEADQEPEEERAALDLSDDPSGKPEEEENDDEGRRRSGGRPPGAPGDEADANR